jgi:hypothetical protein
MPHSTPRGSLLDTLLLKFELDGLLALTLTHSCRLHKEKAEQLEAKADALVVAMTTALDYVDPARARVGRGFTTSGTRGTIRLQGVIVVIIIRIRWRWCHAPVGGMFA